MLNGTGKGPRILKVRAGAGRVGTRKETGKNGEYHGSSLGFSLAPVTTCTCVLLYSQQNNAIHSISQMPQTEQILFPSVH